MFLILVIFGMLACILGVSFAPGTKDTAKNVKNTPGNSSAEINIIEANNGNSTGKDLSEAELYKIVAEQPLDDPLNAFYDPYEPYRLSTFAYSNTITFEKEHVNPPLPAGFIPPNAPPKSFPSDFFINFTDARRIVLGEHAAAFCPYLRRWREKHPLEPYPVGADFLQRHPPIKFTPGKGYDIDTELATLNFLSRKAQEEILEKATKPPGNTEPKGKDTDTKGTVKRGAHKNYESRTEDDKNGKKNSNSNHKSKSKKKKNKKKSVWELSVLKDVIEEVKKSRPDCSKYSKFLEIPPPSAPYLSSQPSCLQEVIFYMDELEDKYDPVEREDNIPEIVDKVEYYRQILLKLDAMKDGNKKGKCPFGFGGGEKSSNSENFKIYQGDIPDWAKLKPGEDVYLSEDDSDTEEMEKYRFAYKQVPFPSIQDTLKKYVSI